MQKLQSYVSNRLKQQRDDDIVDRLNYHWTPVMLSFFALGLITKQYVGQPIQCWIPAEFKEPWEKYSENYCFVENTYFVRFNESFPINMSSHKDREIHYYQWVPFVLIAQMLLFMAPKLLWKAFGCQDGLGVNNLANSLAKLESTLSQSSEENQKMGRSIQRAIEFSHCRSSLITMQKNKEQLNYDPSTANEMQHRSKRNNSKFAISYLFFKFANLVNVVAQFLYQLWGYGILMDLIEGREWSHSGHFPRVTFCDISIREMGNRFVHHTFQCVLMINMINEKLYVFLWFWLAFLVIANVLNIAVWVYRMTESSAISFIRWSLYSSNRDLDAIPNDKMKVFYRKYLGRDTVTILRLIDLNSNEEAHEIVHELWSCYVERQQSEAKNTPAEKKIPAELLHNFNLRELVYNDSRL